VSVEVVEIWSAPLPHSPGVLPPGWPAEVRPPDTDGWERSATAWLFDLCPPDYRAHEVLVRHPLVLARFARQHVESGVEAARQGLRTVRRDLGRQLGNDVVDAAIAAYDREGRRLLAAGKQVELVEAALRGERWVPKL
jgi:hypothetical protein